MDNNGSLDIIEEHNYYPFGLKHKGYNDVVSANVNSVANRFKYNGKELQDELGLTLYHYGARFYDQFTARFISIDPMSEEFHFQSPYVYAANNPVYFEEKNGESPDPPEVLASAQSFLGTMYEWGGKNPEDDLVGTYNDATVGAASVSPEIQGRGTTRGELQQTSKNLRSYYYDGKGSTQAVYDKFNVSNGSSFGIDCSGLASEAFNSDTDKLMGDLRVGTAHDQRQQFADAMQEGTGFLHENANLIGMGDLVFYENSGGRITHVMVATGKVQKDKDGNVTRFQIIHAPQSGGKVEYAWRTFRQGRHSVGHTHRKGEENNTTNVWTWLSNFLSNFENFTENYQNE